MERLANLQEIISWLKHDDPRLGSIDTPSTLRDCQQLMRALLNIRAPRTVDDAFLRMQDAELQMQLADKGIVTPSKHKAMQLWQGDITRLQVDAIVNAANAQMLGCFQPLHGCIDNAIHSAAGVQLRLECNEVMTRLGREAKTSEAIITRGYNLPASYVIHTVGPIIPNGIPTPGQEHQLVDCYRHCLALAEEYHLESIAFCCISTGVFMFPQRRAAELAVSSVRSWLETHRGNSVKTVVFNVFKDEDKQIYEKILGNEDL